MVVRRAENQSSCGTASHGLGPRGFLYFLDLCAGSERCFWFGNVDNRDSFRIARQCAGTGGRCSVSGQKHVRPKGFRLHTPLHVCPSRLPCFSPRTRAVSREHILLRGTGDYSLDASNGFLGRELLTLCSLVDLKQGWTQCIPQWLALLALVSYSTQVVTRSDLPMYAQLATHDSHSLENDVVIILHTHHLRKQKTMSLHFLSRRVWSSGHRELGWGRRLLFFFFASPSKREQKLKGDEQSKIHKEKGKLTENKQNNMENKRKYGQLERLKDMRRTPLVFPCLCAALPRPEQYRGRRRGRSF